MRTVICHFFNEEYLLPWWLKHHLPLFDHGVLIDHGSTDGSADICRALAPDWRLVRSQLLNGFDTFMTDFEVMCYEKELPGWKIALNVTEFLMPSITMDEVEAGICKHGLKGVGAHGMLMAAPEPGTELDPDRPLPLQQCFGVDDNAVTGQEERTALGLDPHHRHRNRFYHCLPVGMYPPGRHQSYHPDSRRLMLDLMIFHYAYAPWNDAMKQRKMQIGGKITPDVRINDWGIHHFRDAVALDRDYAKLKVGAIDLRTHPHAGRALEKCGWG